MRAGTIVARRIAIGLWLAAAVVTWNGVFDRHVERGARTYLDRQAAFEQGRGPRADMDATMRAAVRGGAGSAGLWTLAILAPGVVVLAVNRRRRPS